MVTRMFRLLLSHLFDAAASSSRGWPARFFVLLSVMSVTRKSPTEATARGARAGQREPFLELEGGTQLQCLENAQ